MLLAHDDGRSQLLLSLIGTVPIVYQSATYNIPVAFWLPTSYPSVAPIVFVTPTALMLVKAGKYVDISGRCYHPYLAYWSNRSDVSASI
jgi:ESCRT-I complex subunit TSG101